MAKVWLPGLSGRLSKSLAGQVTYQTFKGIQTARTKPVPTGLPSQAQLDIRQTIKDLYSQYYSGIKGTVIEVAFKNYGMKFSPKLSYMNAIIRCLYQAENLGLNPTLCYSLFQYNQVTFWLVRFDLLNPVSFPLSARYSFNDMRHWINCSTNFINPYYHSVCVYGPYDKARTCFVEVNSIAPSDYVFSGIHQTVLPKL